MWSLTQSELKAPLLGTEQDEGALQQQSTKPIDNNDDDTIESDTCSSDDEDDDDDDEIGTGCTMTCTFNTQDSDDDNEETVRSCFVDHWIIWVVLPLLLVLQFGMALSASKVEDSTDAAAGAQEQKFQLDIATVNYSIVLFMMASYLFRRAISASGCNWIFVHLLPEIVMDVVLGLVLFHHVIVGFLVMVAATCIMALYSALSNCRLFVRYETIDELTPRSKDSKKTVDDDYIAVV